MKLNRFLYGSLAALSLLGFLGFITGEKAHFAFFAFALHLKYFFIKPDEMLVEYMNKAASTAFYTGALVMALVTLIMYFTSEIGISRALVYGLAANWIIAILFYSFMIIYYEMRELRGMKND